MNRRMLFLLAVLCLAAVPMRAQNTVANSITLVPTTVSGLGSAAAFPNAIKRVNDGATAADCTIGGGSFIVDCLSNGSTWAAYGGGAGANVAPFTHPAGYVNGGYIAQYAAPFGNDANDGLSWGTAKLTWDAAAEALNGGSATGPVLGNSHVIGTGTIYIWNGTQACPASSSDGIYILGAAGPGFPSTSTCWENTYGGQIQTICVGGIAGTDNGAGKCQIIGGNASDSWHPGLWLSAAGSLEWKNVSFGGEAVPIIIGYCPDHSSPNSGQCGSGNLNFDGLNVNTDQGSASGPGILIGTNTLWVSFHNFFITGNLMASGFPTSDASAAVVIGPHGGNGSGFITFDTGTVYGGGFKVYNGTQGSGVSISHLASENNLEAMVWVQDSEANTANTLLDVGPPSDCAGPPADCYTLRNDTINPVASFGGAGVNSGPVQNYQPVVQGSGVLVPGTSGTFGFISPWKWRAESDAAAREFPPVISIGSPLVDSTITAPTITLCGTCSLTTGESAPSGGTNAVQVSDSNAGGDSVFIPATSDGGAVVGDTYVYSIWAQSTNGGHPTVLLRGFSVGGFTCAANAWPNADNVYSLEQSWQHYVTACKISTMTNPGIPELQLAVSSTATMQYFNPQIFLLHGKSDAEVAEIILNLGTWNSSCAAGQLCDINGPVANVLGILDQTGVSTANSGSAQNILASTPAAGKYRVSVYADESAGCTTVTSGALTVVLGWTDATHARVGATLTLTPGTADTGTGSLVTQSQDIWSAASSAITVTDTYVACSVGTWTYDQHATVERVE